MNTNQTRTVPPSLEAQQLTQQHFLGARYGPAGQQLSPAQFSQMLKRRNNNSNGLSGAGDETAGSARSFPQKNVVDLTNDSSVANNTEKPSIQELHALPIPEVIDLDEADEAEPAAKRIKITDREDKGKNEEDDTLASSSPDAMLLDPSEEAAYRATTGTPLPRPPPTSSSTFTSHTLPSAAAKRHDLYQRKANGLKPPSLAVPLSNARGVADFAPWTGNHPEDILNEQVVKAGYSDKAASTTQNESGSAMSVLWPNLSQKNNIGLQTLSHLFIQVIEKRQTMGKCTAPSSFKPPPRVTVTDTKREAWLRDLANLEVPLRKQSRTIPHGIRGKLLMEQCLSKNIPLQRAVWLAKCVGANEIRAFKRKGVNGTSATSGGSKWIREWTVQVEQFIEGVISSCGKVEQWKVKMDYAVKLASHFYIERLLDCEHYLDWVVDSFAQANRDQLPVWMILAQLYWQGVTCFGRRGRKFSVAIIKHLRKIGHHEQVQPLRQRLERLLVVIAATKRASLIIPTHWHECKAVVAEVLSAATSHSPGARLALQSITKRNEALVRSTQDKSQTTASPALKVVRMLDKIDLDADLSVTVDTCLTLIQDPSRLSILLLRWASSAYRKACGRKYMAARIINQLSHQGLDVDSAVLDFLRQAEGSAAVDPPSAYAAVSELARLQCFSAGKFMQWIMTSGALYTATAASGLVSGLLRALPVDTRNINMRNSLLRRLGVESPVTADDEKLRVTQRVFASARLEGPAIQIPELSTASPDEVVAISCWISNTITELSRNRGLTLVSYIILRDLLEQLENIPVLVDLLYCASVTDGTALLASATETLSFHVHSVAALGELPLLTEKLIERYKTIRSQQPLDRSFVLALNNLVQRIPTKAVLLRPLMQDLMYCEQQNSMMVCSPASDNMSGMHASHLDSEADIDAVFASGNTMDEQLIQRVFMRVMQQAEKGSHSPSAETSSKLGGWLKQLRTLDSHTFDNLARDYARSYAHISANSGDVGTYNGVVTLVACNCLPMESVVEPLWAVNSCSAAAVATHLLAMYSPARHLHPVEQYRYKLYQRKFVEHCPNKVIANFQRACLDAKFSVDDQHVRDFAASLTIIRGDYLFHNVSDRTPMFRENSYRLCRHLLQRGVSVDTSSSPSLIEDIVKGADALSIPFYSGMLRLISQDCPYDTDRAQELKSVVTEAIMTDHEVWPQLLGTFDGAFNRDFNNWAREQLVSSSTENSIQSESVRTKNLILAISLTKQRAREDDSDIYTLVALGSRLRSHEKQLSEIPGTTKGDAECRACLEAIEISLQLVAQNLESSTSETEALVVKKSNVLGALCTLLLHPQLQAHQSTIERLFDLSSTLSDSLGLEVVSNLAQGVPPGVLSANPRIVSILGTSVSPDAWISLAFRSQTPGSQQQRLFSRQQSQYQHGATTPTNSGSGGGGGSSIAATARHMQGQSPQTQAQPPHLRLTAQAVAANAAANAAADATPPPSSLASASGRGPSLQAETKTVPYILRRWETMPDPTPVMGENDTSLSLGLFGARRSGW